jgi:hypothetical protein
VLTFHFRDCLFNKGCTKLATTILGIPTVFMDKFLRLNTTFKSKMNTLTLFRIHVPSTIRTLHRRNLLMSEMPLTTYFTGHRIIICWYRNAKNVKSIRIGYVKLKAGVQKREKAFAVIVFAGKRSGESSL